MTDWEAWEAEQAKRDAEHAIEMARIEAEREARRKIYQMFVDGLDGLDGQVAEMIRQKNEFRWILKKVCEKIPPGARIVLMEFFGQVEIQRVIHFVNHDEDEETKFFGIDYGPCYVSYDWGDQDYVSGPRKIKVCDRNLQHLAIIHNHPLDYQAIRNMVTCYSRSCERRSKCLCRPCKGCYGICTGSLYGYLIRSARHRAWDRVEGLFQGVTGCLGREATVNMCLEMANDMLINDGFGVASHVVGMMQDLVLDEVSMGQVLRDYYDKIPRKDPDNWADMSWDERDQILKTFKQFKSEKILALVTALPKQPLIHQLFQNINDPSLADILGALLEAHIPLDELVNYDYLTLCEAILLKSPSKILHPDLCNQYLIQVHTHCMILYNGRPYQPHIETITNISRLGYMDDDRMVTTTCEVVVNRPALQRVALVSHFYDLSEVYEYEHLKRLFSYNWFRESLDEEDLIEF